MILDEATGWGWSVVVGPGEPALTEHVLHASHCTALPLSSLAILIIAAPD